MIGGAALEVIKQLGETDIYIPIPVCIACLFTIVLVIVSIVIYRKRK